MTNPDERYAIRHNSSIDYVNRCVKFYESAEDFMEVLDLHDNEETGEFQEMLRKIEKRAVEIVREECS